MEEVHHIYLLTLQVHCAPLKLLVLPRIVNKHTPWHESMPWQIISMMEWKLYEQPKEVIFNINNFVLVKLQHYHQQSVASCLSNKLARRFLDPFQIVECIGKVAYKLLLLANAHIHDVFHYSLLKKFTIDGLNIFPTFLEDLMALSEDGLFSNEGETDMNNMLPSKHPRRSPWRLSNYVYIWW